MIKVLVPDMPKVDELLPFLRRIDEARHYTNRGQLVQQLEGELSGLVKAPCTVVANGTLSLELALRAMGLPPGAGVLVPAVTYVATGQAIVNAGLTPVLCDVDLDTWQLDADHAYVMSRRDGVRAAIPVAAFGAPVQIGPWESFAYKSGMHVLIDAAGAIMDQQHSTHPRVHLSYSLHATKALGAGEGGVVASHNAALVKRVAELAAFGQGGTNAKMSEYHAAVGLASLRRSSTWRTHVDAWYAQGLPSGLKLQAGQRQRARTLFPVLLPPGSPADRVLAAMQDLGIQCVRWYWPFMHQRAQFFDSNIKAGPMPVTEVLRDRLLGLPYHAFLTEADVAQVCSALTAAIA